MSRYVECLARDTGVLAIEHTLRLCVKVQRKLNLSSSFDDQERRRSSGSSSLSDVNQSPSPAQRPCKSVQFESSLDPVPDSQPPEAQSIETYAQMCIRVAEFSYLDTRMDSTKLDEFLTRSSRFIHTNVHDSSSGSVLLTHHDQLIWRRILNHDYTDEESGASSILEQHSSSRELHIEENPPLTLEHPSLAFVVEMVNCCITTGTNFTAQDVLTLCTIDLPEDETHGWL